MCHIYVSRSTVGIFWLQKTIPTGCACEKNSADTKVTLLVKKLMD